MDQEEKNQASITKFLQSGRHLLEQATAVFERQIRPEEYWLMGVGLSAMTLASLNNQPYAIDRFDALIEELGYQGPAGDWWGRFQNEIAHIGSAGMLWPVFERNEDGLMAPTGCKVRRDFNGADAYWLALAHVASALSSGIENAETVANLAETIVDLVEVERTPAMEDLILKAYTSQAGKDHTAGQ